MQISEIAFSGVMSYPAGGQRPVQVVSLPRTGLVVVTGPNGAGKSSIIEVVSVTGWGESLRGKSIWREDEAASSCVTTYDNLSITRTHKTRTKLVFRPDGEGYETTTKAQAALERIIGSHDLWRRTCVFSSQDADHFTLAPDAVRKKLLEDILGLDRFDRAYAACHADLKGAVAAFNRAVADHTRACDRREATKQRLQDAQTRLAALPVLPPPLDLTDIESRLKALRAQVKALDVPVHAAEAVMTAARHRVARLKEQQRQPSVCATCGSVLTKTKQEDLAAELLEAETALADATENLEATKVRLAPQYDAIEEEEIPRLIEKRGEARAQAAEAERVAEQRETLEKAVKDLSAAHEDVCDEVEALADEVTSTTNERDVLAAADQALSMTGIRAHLLASAIGSVEAVANTWLDRLAPVRGSLSFRLTPYTLSGSGTIKDAISMEVIGAGGGHGYRGASGGERRRIDIAVMLALAEIAEYASGAAPGTMFMDEVFDALDADFGVPRATNVLQELSRTRCVVVVTHNAELARALKPTQHLHVENGSITRL